MVILPGYILGYGNNTGRSLALMSALFFELRLERSYSILNFIFSQPPSQLKMEVFKIMSVMLRSLPFGFNTRAAARQPEGVIDLNSIHVIMNLCVGTFEGKLRDGGSRILSPVYSTNQLRSCKIWC